MRAMLTKEELAKIQERYEVKSRDWLEFAPEYQGRGEAEFSTNPGVIRGPMSVRYAEDGSLERFEMTVEELLVGQQLHGPDALFTFVHALPIPSDPHAFGFGAASNRCTRVELTDDGLHVRAAQRSDVMASAGNDRVSFRPYRTIATFEPDMKPHFWAAPLLNFTSGFAVATRDLQGHPLRIRETNAYEAVAGEADFYHQFAYQQGNALIPFRCEAELGFIEPLADYGARAARVEAGETVVTAVMVGRVREGFDADVDDEWFPPELVTLLGLATGRAVGVPFVELRGSGGELVAAAREDRNAEQPASARPDRGGVRPFHRRVALSVLGGRASRSAMATGVVATSAARVHRRHDCRRSPLAPVSRGRGVVGWARAEPRPPARTE